MRYWKKPPRWAFGALLWVALAAGLSPLSSVRAQEGEAGHVHGPDGRHVAVGETPAAAGAHILSHHDLKITDSSKLSAATEGALVEGGDVQSVIHKKGDPNAVVHREHNAYEADNGVYGSHMMYREPGEYVIVENVTLPGGKKYILQFPIWVPGPEGSPAAPGWSPPLLAAGALLVLALIAAAFLLGRRSGRKSAAPLALLALAAGLVPFSGVRAQDGEAGHVHGPDGRHIAVAETFGPAGSGLRAYLGPNREIEAVETRDHYRFHLSIENEVLEADPDLVTLEPEAAAAIGLEVVASESRPLAGGLATTGQVRPNPDGAVTVNSRVAGRVLRVNATPGQQIRRGQVVAVIDSTEVAEAQAALVRAQAERGRAEAARAQARAGLVRANAAVRQAEASLERVRAQRAEAAADLEHERAEAGIARGRAEAARQSLERQRQLAAAGAFAQGPVETARSAVADAEGELETARAGLDGLEAQARRLDEGLRAGVTARKELEAAQTALAQGRTRVDTAQRRLAIARAALSREERIRRDGLRDASEVQRARAELEITEGGVRSAEAAVARQERAVDAADALVASQERAVQGARADLQVAASEVRQADAQAGGAREAVRSALDRLLLLGARPGAGNAVTVTAPIAGEVHTRPVSVGQVVAAGQPLCTIVDTASVWVESDVFERDLFRVREGQRVSIAAGAVPGRLFEGVIGSVENEVDPQTRAVHVRTILPNPGGLLKPNMFVRVIISSEEGSAVVVPLEAVQDRSGAELLFVEDAPGRYRRRAVTLGPALGDRVVIETGLRPGERVVTRGSYQLLSRLQE
jgi:RND family efflux transporter MFP subunit